MSDSFRYSVLFAVLGAVFFLPFLGGVHLFDWDEINFAEISREMIVLNDYLRVHVDFKPFWEKPPFFFWLQSLSMLIIGIGEYAARLPNAICGIITLVLLFNLGKKLHNTTFGIIWAGIYLGTVLPHLYFKSGIIDPFFNLFIFIGLYHLIFFYWKKENYTDIRLNKGQWQYLFLSGFFVGMGILTKGPVAYLIVFLTLAVYMVTNRLRKGVNLFQFVFFTVASAIVMLLWYGLETYAHGTWFVEEFTKYQYRLFSTPDAGHKGFFGYHFVVLLIGCFPASIFCIRSFFRQKHDHAFQQDFKKWMMILFWVVLILFTIVKSKIVHYSSMCYFPLTYLAAISVYQILQNKIRFSKWMRWSLGIIGSIYGIAVIAAPFLGMHTDVIKPLLNDPFAVASLQADVNWTGWEALCGVFILVITVTAIYLISRQRKKQGFITLFGGTAVFVFITLIFFIAKIERYSQHAAIAFFESLEGKDCYVTTWRYKSYGQLFYTKKQPPENERSYDKQWLISGDIDKDVYFVCKVHQCEELEAQDDTKQLYSKNGFVFYKRQQK